MRRRMPDTVNVTLDITRAVVGDYVICMGEYARVTAVRDYAPYQHPGSPIYNDMHAREVETTIGSRWFGWPVFGSVR